MSPEAAVLVGGAEGLVSTHPAPRDDPVSRSRTDDTRDLVAFGYKHGLPLDVDMVFDCRFLPNPHWVDELRPLTGRDEPEIHARCIAAGCQRVMVKPPKAGELLRAARELLGG